MSLLGRLRSGGRDSEEGPPAAGSVLVVGLGNPGSRYTRTRHNLGFEVAAELSRRWDLPRAKEKFKGRIAEGRIRPGGPRVAVLIPLTYMNESGQAAGPAFGSMRIPLERVVVLHDEIDLPFGEVRSKQGGGAGGHNGLKSLRTALGGDAFWRVRGGVGRPDTTDPEIVSAHVLGRFRESDGEVRELIARTADEAERLIEQIAEAERVGA